MAFNSSQAKPLKEFHRRTLLQKHDYKYYTPDPELFSKIESNFKVRINPELFSKIESNFKILNVEDIRNPYLYGMYLLHKEELSVCNDDDRYERTEVKELLLYHATSYENALSIAKENIDWRKTRRSRFGIGAYFSDDPEYANTYSNSRGAFLICKVLVKRKYMINVQYNLAVPLPKYDTTYGGLGSRVYTKYDDFTFYPTYIVQYK